MAFDLRSHTYFYIRMRFLLASEAVVKTANIIPPRYDVR
jgi:hypothetical protein